MVNKLSVTAVILGHGDRKAIEHALIEAQNQTDKPNQIIVCVCCMEVDSLLDMGADMVLLDNHVDDIGQRFCDFGLRLANQEYVWFYSCDDEYSEDWLKSMRVDEPVDLILGGFESRLVGRIEHSEPILGKVTRGSFLVRREKGLEVGYTGREYSSDGKFIRDLVDSGATWTATGTVLYKHL